MGILNSLFGKKETVLTAQQKIEQPVGVAQDVKKLASDKFTVTQEIQALEQKVKYHQTQLSLLAQQHAELRKKKQDINSKI